MDRLIRGRTSGQSIPLIALVLVVLFAMVGLSVDVGNTYAEQRAVVRATNSAALSAMNAVIQNVNDQGVANTIYQSYQSNGLTIVNDPNAELGPDERRVYARYLKADGNPVAACLIGSCGSINGGMPPQGVAYIQIQAEGTVDTYFARVVGRDTLPVNTQAFAAQCTASTGVYPIGVQASALNANGFAPPTSDAERPFYGTFTDPGEVGLGSTFTQRRLYLKDFPDNSGTFSFLRWRTDQGVGDRGALTEMLRGDGGLYNGYNEVVPWPDANTSAPATYPLEPEQLSLGDWVHGNPGFANTGGYSGVEGLLQGHIDDRTRMNLPIGRYVRVGNTTAFSIDQIGQFYLRGFGQQPDMGWYMDLVYLGDASRTPCLRTNIEITDELGLIGEVYINPRSVSTINTAEPISWQIILDVSGSMSWNFNGEGTRNGVGVQCERGHASTRFAFDPNCSGFGDPWRVESERRIYVAKQALNGFIDRMGPNDTMRLIAFSSNENGNAGVYPAEGWVDPANPNAKQEMKNAVRQAGAYNGNPYLTRGGTPTPQALQRANQILASGAPTEAPNGLPYRQVTILMVDGVANYFLDGTRNDAADICGHIPTINERANTADPCQLGTTADGRNRPVIESMRQANLLKEQHDVSLFVVAMGGVNEVGFDLMASQPDWVYTAKDPVDIGAILQFIGRKIDEDSCKPDAGIRWRNRINAANAPTPPLGDGVYGFVTLKDNNGVPLPDGRDRLPIRHDPVSGNLSFSLPQGQGLAPGLYQIEAFVQYKGEDGVTRPYNWIISSADPTGAPSRAFRVTSADTLGNVVVLDHLFLDLDRGQTLCAP